MKKLGKIALKAITEEQLPAAPSAIVPPEALRPHGVHDGCRAMRSLSGRWAAHHWYDQQHKLLFLDDDDQLREWAHRALERAELAPDGKAAAIGFRRAALRLDLPACTLTTIWGGTVHALAFTSGGLLAVLADRQLLLVDLDDPDFIPLSTIAVAYPHQLVAGDGVLVVCAEETVVVGVAGRELRELARFKKKTSDGEARGGRIFIDKYGKDRKRSRFEVTGFAEHVAALGVGSGAPAVYRSDPAVRVSFAPASDADAAMCEAHKTWKAPDSVSARLSADWIAKLATGGEAIVAWDNRSGNLSWLASPDAEVGSLEHRFALSSVSEPRDGRTLLVAEKTQLHTVDLTTATLRSLPWHPGPEDGEEGIVSVGWAADGRIVVQTFARLLLLDRDGKEVLGVDTAHWGQGLVTLRGGRFVVTTCSGRLDIHDTAGGALRLVRSLVDAKCHLTVSPDDQRVLLKDLADVWQELQGF